MLALHATIILMAVVGLFARTINLPAWDIIGYRTIVATLALVAWVWWRERRILLNAPRDYGRMLILGLLLGGHWVSYFYSMQISSIAIGMIALYSYPVLTVLIEPWFNRIRLNWRDLVSGCLVILGVYCLVPSFDMSDNMTQGVFWGLLSAFLFALRNILLGHWFKHETAARALGYQTLVVAVCMLPLLYLSEARPSSEDIGLIIVLGLVFTALAHGLLGYSLRFLRPKTVGLVSCIQPVYGVLCAFLVLGSIPTLWTLVGGVLIGSASLYETLQTRGTKS